LLAMGNGKLGRSIFHFDLPAVTTCPGRSSVCERVCYARRHRFRTRAVQRRLRWCLRQSRRADFADRMVDEIRRTGAIVVRIHVSGDFYSADYAARWLAVIRRLPGVRFYCYTRSWRVPEVAPVLARLAAEPNCRVWFSADAETGPPDPVPPGVRVATLQTVGDDPPADTDLLFRVQQLRRDPVPLTVLCPHEAPLGSARGTNCGSCGRCWR
jgi:hypothetical protein